MRYDELNWESLDFIKAHFYRRVATPLNKTIEILERVENAGDKTLAVRRLSKTRQTVEALLNAVNAWATLITFKSNGPLDDYQFQAFVREDIPGWFHAYLSRETTLRVDFNQTLKIHPETLIEATVLLFNVANAISNVFTVQMSDSPRSKKGVFIRVVFSNRDDRAPFGSLTEILESFDYDNLGERDLAVQFAIARDMMLLNNARFSLQNNKKTGQQAFSAFLEASQDLDEEEMSSPFDAYDLSEPNPTPAIMSLRSAEPPTPHLRVDADPDAPGESEAVPTTNMGTDTKPLSISREMVERIEERLKAIQVVDDESVSRSSAKKSHGGKNNTNGKDARTPFGW